MTPTYDPTPEQLADISTAFEALSEETKGKFDDCENCGAWGEINYVLHEGGNERVEICPVCRGMGHLPTSDRAMAILDEMKIKYKLGNQYRISDNRDYCRLFDGPPHLGTSPLHALLLAIKQIGG